MFRLVEDAPEYLEKLPILTRIFRNIVVHEEVDYTPDTMYIYCYVRNAPKGEAVRRVRIPSAIVGNLARVQKDGREDIADIKGVHYISDEGTLAVYVPEDNVLITTDITHIYNSAGLMFFSWILMDIMENVKVSNEESKEMMLVLNGKVFKLVPLQVFDNIEQVYNEKVASLEKSYKEIIAHAKAMVNHMIAQIESYEPPPDISPETPVVVRELTRCGCEYCIPAELTFDKITDENGKTYKTTSPLTLPLLICVRFRGRNVDGVLLREPKTLKRFYTIHSLSEYECLGDYRLPSRIDNFSEFWKRQGKTIVSVLSTINFTSPARQPRECSEPYRSWLEKQLEEIDEGRAERMREEENKIWE